VVVQTRAKEVTQPVGQQRQCAAQQLRKRKAQSGSVGRLSVDLVGELEYGLGNGK
jgi:hypothetical protein